VVEATERDAEVIQAMVEQAVDAYEDGLQDGDWDAYVEGLDELYLAYTETEMSDACRFHLDLELSTLLAIEQYNFYPTELLDSMTDYMLEQRPIAYNSCMLAV
jgi:hypothetical protein